MDRVLGQRPSEPHPRPGFVRRDQKSTARFKGLNDLGSRPGVQGMTPVLEITDGTARDVRPFGEFLLGPVQEATGGTALFRSK